MKIAAPYKIVSEKNACLLFSGIFVIYLLYRCIAVFITHPDAGGVEGNVVYFIQRLLDGQTLYSDPELPPYAIAQYSPFYYYLVYGIARVFGVRADDVYNVYATGRIVSLVLNLAFVGLVYKVCRQLYKVRASRSFIAAVAAFIFLEITSFARPDSLYHFFFLLTLYYFLLTTKIQEEGNRGSLFIIITGIIVVFAVFSKQTAIVLPVIIGGWWMVKKEHKNFLLFAVASVLTATVLTAFMYKYEGAAFFRNVVGGINNGISLGWYSQVVLMPMAKSFGLPLFIAFIMVLWIVKNDSSKMLRQSGFVLLLLFVFLNGIGLKMGAGPGYFTEWWTWLFVLLAYYWPVIVSAFKIFRVPLPALVVLAVALLKLYMIITPIIEKSNALSSSGLMYPYQSQVALAKLMKSKLQPGDTFVVFTFFYTPDSYLSNLLFRHAVIPQMEIVSLSTYPDKRYDYSDFKKRMNDGSIPWMLMRSKDSSRQFYDISLDKYEKTDSLNGFTIYHYKP
jgi:hypothetical protein